MSRPTYLPVAHLPKRDANQRSFWAQKFELFCGCCCSRTFVLIAVIIYFIFLLSNNYKQQKTTKNIAISTQLQPGSRAAASDTLNQFIESVQLSLGLCLSVGQIWRECNTRHAFNWCGDWHQGGGNNCCHCCRCCCCISAATSHCRRQQLAYN